MQISWDIHIQTNVRQMGRCTEFPAKVEFLPQGAAVRRRDVRTVVDRQPGNGLALPRVKARRLSFVEEQPHAAERVLDKTVHTAERPAYDQIVNELNDIIAAAYTLRYAEDSE